MPKMMKMMKAVAFGALLGAACSRSLPASFPPGSAASPEAREAPAARVGVVLAEDPPMPGEPSAGWLGLEPAAADDAPPAMDHSHHHHHGAPEAPAADGGADAPHVH